MSKAAAAALLSLGLFGCAKEGDIMATGILANYTACPPVAIAAPTGDITFFNPANSRDADAIDLVAQITNVRGTCNDSGEFIVTEISFDVQARRRDAAGARDATLPYFATVIQGGTNIVAKRVSRVGIHFDDGQLRTSTSASATEPSVLRPASARQGEASISRRSRRSATSELRTARTTFRIPSATGAGSSPIPMSRL